MLLRLALILGTLSFCITSSCQSITVRLLDGRSGKPLSSLHVVIYGNREGRQLPIKNEGDIYNVDVTGETSIQLGEIRSSTPNIVEFTTCQSQETFIFNVNQIQANGITGRNRCSKKSYPSTPGELIIFVRKTRWWDRWKDFG